MSRALVSSAVVLVAIALSACESTQDKAAKIRAAGDQVLAGRHGLKVTKINPDVKVLGKTIITDKNGTAVVVELENKGKTDEAQVPIAIQLADAKGKKVFANDAPGLDPALVSVPLLPKGKGAFWVHNQILAAAPPKKLAVKVGVAPKVAVPSSPPRITLSNIKTENDADGAFVTGVVHNHSDVEQKRLTIFCVAKKGDEIIAAGRAVVDKLPTGTPKKPIRFSVYFIGNPDGGKLEFSVPPVALR